MIKDFDLLIFDMDGVLVNTTPCHERAFAELWQKLEINGPAYEDIAGRKTSDVVAEYTVGLKPTESQVDEWVQFKQGLARQYLVSGEIAFHDSAECISQLTVRKIRLALGTGASRKTTASVLNRQGWGEAFSVIVTGEDVSQGKPEPEIYLAAMERAGVSPHRTLVVEDSQAGLASAIAAGAYAAVVRTGRSVKDERFIGSFPDLKTLFATMGDGRE